MGYYINPSDGSSKESWLRKNGQVVPENWARRWEFRSKDLPVCLINNVSFTAAGIAYNQSEADIFLVPDGRQKCWYSVPKEKLKEFIK